MAPDKQPRGPRKHEARDGCDQGGRPIHIRLPSEPGQRQLGRVAPVKVSPPGVYGDVAFRPTWSIPDPARACRIRWVRQPQVPKEKRPIGGSPGYDKAAFSP